ncbi:MAG TPA: bifunctional UDP-N-acetylglucosamine diphosphorylase/glucosamine-1-phosphate N-acetyltransferase GlmU [Geobacteraceae bacterium]
MDRIAAIVIAAGKGTRMKSNLAKVLHPVGGEPMVCWPVAAAQEVGAGTIVLVVGHQAQEVQQCFAGHGGIAFALQEEQLGTGHAVACAANHLRGFRGTVVILCGDVPLIRVDTLRAMLACHEKRSAVVTVLTTQLDDPFGYGRVIKSDDGRVLHIVEEKDADAEQKRIREINSGIYCVEAEFLFDAVQNITNENAQTEYYLTDIVKIAADRGGLCVAYETRDVVEVMGVNDRVQLAAAGAELRRRKNEELMLGGVSIIDPATAYIDKHVTIGADTLVYPGVSLVGQTRVGCGCVLEPGVVIKNCQVGDRVVVKAGSVLSDSTIHDNVAVGPMAHLRPGTVLMSDVKIGNFVETKKMTMGKGSKASHLTYLGDATVGENVNIGCGTITCNYDGVNKHRTVIEDDVFVGSDVQLVAPVRVGRNSLIAAGTTVTTDVPPDSLAIARTPQVNKVGWKLKKK